MACLGYNHHKQHHKTIATGTATLPMITTMTTAATMMTIIKHKNQAYTNSKTGKILFTLNPFFW
jgi:hypothetical protein